MKYLFSFFLIGCLLMTACTKTDTPPVKPPVKPIDTSTAFLFTFKVDGVPYNMKYYSAGRDFSTFPTRLIISASNEVTVTPKPFLSFTLEEKQESWTPGLEYKMDYKDLKSTVIYTNEQGYNFKSIATPEGETSFYLKFSRIYYEKDSILEATFSGSLQTEESATLIKFTEGRFRMPILY